MQEVWKDIVGYEGLYQVSNFGDIKSLRQSKEKILKPIVCNGYLQVCLYKKEKKEKIYIHRLVAKTFIPNPNNYKEVNHKQGNKSDNRASELEWITHKRNIQHSYNTGLKDSKSVRKKVLQYDLKGNFLKEWNCILEAEKELNILSTNICKCCREKHKSAGGYKWKYKD